MGDVRSWLVNGRDHTARQPVPDFYGVTRNTRGSSRVQTQAAPAARRTARGRGPDAGRRASGSSERRPGDQYVRYTKNMIRWDTPRGPLDNTVPGTASSTPTSRSGATGRSRAPTRASGSSTSRTRPTRSRSQLGRSCDESPQPEHGGQPGRRDRLGQPRLPIVELGHAAPQEIDRRSADSIFRSPTRAASRFRARSATTGRCSASLPLRRCPSAARRASTSSTSATRSTRWSSAFVDTPCGSHTATAVPDLANNRVLIYNSPSANTTFGRPGDRTSRSSAAASTSSRCRWPTRRRRRTCRQLPSGDPMEPVEERHSCHDTGVILGDAMKMACCRRRHGIVDLHAWTRPRAARSKTRSSCTTSSSRASGIGHSAVFTGTARYVIFGHEPGGGSRRQCQATSSTARTGTLFFVDVEAGT